MSSAGAWYSTSCSTSSKWPLKLRPYGGIEMCVLLLLLLLLRKRYL